MADSHIRELTRSRGYLPQKLMPRNVSLDSELVIHPCAANDLRKLFSAAYAAGHHLALASGFRSHQKQRQIFLSKMIKRKINVWRISTGDFDRELDAILQYSATPGFSRHHTGFAVDLRTDNRGLRGFGDSEVYAWLSANRFEVARRFGFIPSYPGGLAHQGPDPEPWEFLWVGRSVNNELKQQIAGDRDNLKLAARRILNWLESDQQPMVTSDVMIAPTSTPGG